MSSRRSLARFLEECREMGGDGFADLHAAAEALGLAYDLTETEL